MILPCLLSVTLMCIYVLNLLPSLNLATVNVLCLFLFFAELVFGLLENKNKEKCILFFAAVFIGTASVGLNLWTDFQELEAILLSGLSGWSLVWAILLLIAAVSFLIILIRELRWSQDQWEAARKLRQQHRLDKKASRSKYILDKQTSRQNFQTQEQADRQSAEAEVRNLKQKVKKQLWEIKVAATKVHTETRDGRDQPKSEITPPPIRYIGGWEKTGIALTILLVLLAIAGFFLLPLWTSFLTHTANWLEAVTTLVTSLNIGENLTMEQAVLSYVFFYFLVVVLVGTILFLTLQFIKQRLKIKSDTGYKFLETYQSSIAVLLVFSAVLFTLTNGYMKLSGITKTWEFLLLVILIILLLLTAVELVRIVLNQCIKPGSLLKKLIYLVFVAVSKFLIELILGVITNFRIQMAVSSILALVFPDPDESENSFYNRLNQKLTVLFNHAIDEEPDDDPTPPTPDAFRRQRIWRRHKP